MPSIDSGWLARLRGARVPGSYGGARLCACVALCAAAAVSPGTVATAADRAPVRAEAPPDTIYVNARVWTGDDAQPAAAALAVRGDTLVAVGSTADVRRRAGPRTAVVDLGGRRVVPGFVDAHWHVSPTRVTALYASGTFEELRRRLQTLAQTPSSSGWIHDGGWAYAEFPDRIPHRRHVDPIVGDRPAWFEARDGHMGLASTRALALAGITRDTPDPPGGRIERDDRGEPTGELKGSAMQFVRRLIPAPSVDDIVARLRADFASASSHGITSVHELANATDDILAAYDRLLADGGFTVRLYGALTLDGSPAGIARAKALRDRYRGRVLRFGMTKGVLDGTIDAQTAWMLEPYTSGSNGMLYRLPEDVRKAVAAYDREGFQVALHATGDHTIRFAMEVLESAARANGPRARRHRIEHIDVPHAEELRRMRDSGTIASSQPNFAYPDDTNLTNYAVLLGPERMRRAQAYADIDRAGVVQVFGSDYPVSPMNVLYALHTAVTRTTDDGRPAGGWYPEQRLSVEAALRHFTRDGAYASFDEQRLGTLAPGKLADFVVLSEDILASPERTLRTARVLMTVMGGRVVHSSD